MLKFCDSELKKEYEALHEKIKEAFEKACVEGFKLDEEYVEVDVNLSSVYSYQGKIHLAAFTVLENLHKNSSEVEKIINVEINNSDVKFNVIHGVVAKRVFEQFEKMPKGNQARLRAE